MIELEIIKSLIDLASSLLSLKNYFSKSERRKEISEWLYQLGDIIENLAHFLDNDQYPSSTCARIQTIYDNLDRIIGDAIPSKDEENIKNLINSCLNIERTFYEYINLEEPDKVDCVRDLYSISGSILGIADTLRFGK